MPTERDSRGRFLHGHRVGAVSRFRQGEPSANPRGRPWGVNKWVRVLRSRRYAKHELEDVFVDEHAPPNQREAAMRLLLALAEESPPFEYANVLEWARPPLESLPTADLRSIVVDPRKKQAERAAAYAILADRGQLKPAPQFITRQQQRAARQSQYRALVAQYRIQ